MELRICDLRNAKFQGQTVNKAPAGFGFLLDQNYTFVVGHINNGELVGNNAIIFGDSNKICFDMERGDGLTVFTNKYCKIYKNNKSLAINLTASKILIKLEQTKRNPQSYQIKKKNSKPEPKFRVIEQKKYTNQNFASLLARFMQVNSMSPKQSNYMAFIKENFKNKYRNLMNISQTSKQFALSVRGVGLFLKLMKCQVQSHHFEKVSNVGFTSAQKNPQIYRRYSYFRDYTNCIVQQCIETQPSISVQFQLCEKNCKDMNAILGTTYELETGKKLDKNDPQGTQSNQTDLQKSKQQTRPKQCIKNLRQYYKRSLTFINKYINLSKIYQLKEYFEQVYSCVTEIDGGKYAQVQIQLNGYQVDEYQNPIITKENQVRPSEATLDDWKKQLDRTLGTRDKIFNKKTNTATSPTYYDQIRQSRSRSRSRSRIEQGTFSPQKQKKSRYMQRQIQPQTQKYQPRQKPVEKQNIILPYRRPQKQKKRQNTERVNERSRSQKPLKYLESQTEYQYTKRSDENIRYPNLINSSKNPETMTMTMNNKSRSPYSYKFKYTQQKQDDRLNRKYVNYTQKKQKNLSQSNTPFRNIPNNQKSPIKYHKKYQYNNNY